MGTKFQCHCCKQNIAYDSDAAGRKIRCPNCSTILTIPGAIPVNPAATAQVSKDAILPQEGDKKAPPPLPSKKKKIKKAAPASANKERMIGAIIAGTVTAGIAAVATFLLIAAPKTPGLGGSNELGAISQFIRNDFEYVGRLDMGQIREASLGQRFLDLATEQQSGANQIPEYALLLLEEATTVYLMGKAPEAPANPMAMGMGMGDEPPASPETLSVFILPSAAFLTLEDLAPDSGSMSEASDFPMIEMPSPMPGGGQDALAMMGNMVLYGPSSMVKTALTEPNTNYTLDADLFTDAAIQFTGLKPESLSDFYELDGIDIMPIKLSEDEKQALAEAEATISLQADIDTAIDLELMFRSDSSAAASTLARIGSIGITELTAFYNQGATPPDISAMLDPVVQSFSSKSDDNTAIITVTLPEELFAPGSVEKLMGFAMQKMMSGMMAEMGDQMNNMNADFSSQMQGFEMEMEAMPGMNAPNGTLPKEMQAQMEMQMKGMEQEINQMINGMNTGDTSPPTPQSLQDAINAAMNMEAPKQEEPPKEAPSPVEPMVATAPPAPAAAPSPIPDHPTKVLTSWNLDIAGGTIPTQPLDGSVKSTPFSPETIEWRANQLIFRTSSSAAPKAEIRISQLIFGSDTIGSVDKTVVRASKRFQPIITLRWKDPAKFGTQQQQFYQQYSMRLKINEVTAEQIKGSIFLSMPDGQDSFVSGQFTADVH